MYTYLYIYIYRYICIYTYKYIFIYAQRQNRLERERVFCEVCNDSLADRVFRQLKRVWVKSTRGHISGTWDAIVCRSCIAIQVHLMARYTLKRSEALAANKKCV